MSNKSLTPKQQCFIDEYLKDLNATQAARRAGYSEKTAFRIGQENMQKPTIAAAIREAIKKRSERTKIDADWLLNRMAQEADADISDLYDDQGNIKPVNQWPKIWRQGLVAGLEIETITLGKGEKKRTVSKVSKIKLSDRVKRLEMIGRHIDVQAFKDRVEHSVDGDLAERLAARRQERMENK